MSTAKQLSLLALMEDVNAVYNDGKTHLHRAIERGSDEDVAMLLRCGAIVGTKNGEGQTAFQLAMALRKYDIALVLADHLKDIDNSEFQGICVDFLIKDSIVCSSTEGVLSEEERLCYFIEFSGKIYQKWRPTVGFRLLKKYLEVCDFLAGNWLRGLYSLLELPIIRNSFAHPGSHADSGSECLHILLHVFEQKEISWRDRTAMIRTWVNLEVLGKIHNILRGVDDSVV